MAPTLFPSINETGAFQIPAVLARLDERYQHATRPEAYGAKGDGTTADKAAIQAAVDATPAGGILAFRPGVYVGDGSSPLNNPAAYVKVTKPITILGGPGVSFKNLYFWVQGTHGAPVSLTGTAAAGGKSLNATGHGLVAGDYVQTLSEYNVYTPDAGVFQMGGANPTTGLVTEARATEIHRVESVAGDVVNLMDNLRYKYGTTVSGLTAPITGVSTSQLRKLTMVDGVTFEGITFDYRTNPMGRGILARVAANLTFRDCTFLGRSGSGRHFGCTDVHNLTFDRVKTWRGVGADAAGSAWNSFIIGGGTTGVTIRDSEFHMEYQNIDFSPNRLISDSDPGSDTGTITANSTCQDIRVFDCDFYDSANAVTTHPACFDFTFSNNRVHSGGIGVLCRSLRSMITNNKFHTANSGVTLSSFVEDTEVSGNLFVFSPGGTRSATWNGVSYAPTSSEIATTNKVQNLAIRNNTFRSTSATTSQWGIRLSHEPPAGYTVPEAVKSGLSKILIAENYFDRASVNVGSWINGVTLIGNVFLSASAQSHYIRCDIDSARHSIANNLFTPGGTMRGIKTSTATGVAFGYASANLIGPQLWAFGAAAMDLENASSMIRTDGVPAA